MQRLYSARQIRTATMAIAQQLNLDYKGQQILFLGVLKGSFLFLADLVRHVTVPCTVDFVRLASYGAATASSGQVHRVMPWSDPVRGRHVVVVEEIVDSGHTLARLLADLASAQPASVRVCTLIDKRGRREIPIAVDYRGFELDDGFVIGYGLDYNERYRNLPDIHVLSADEIAPPTERRPHMATWTCPECNTDREARCKPKKCPTCDKPVEYTKKEAKK